MQKIVRAFVTVLVVASLLLSFFILGCTRHANEKQLKALEETKSAALAAEAQQATCDRDKRSLQSQLAETKQKLEAMQQEKTTVSNRLQSM